MYTSFAKVDWNTFDYIHSTNTRDAFQRLTEQLFCFEFKQPYGIYRYYNQPYIETMPIHVSSEYIGFQSKYYDASTKLSDRIDELKNAIDGAALKYPGLTKIVLYTNKEPGISTKGGEEKPSYIQTVETYAADRNISIDWRGLNQIETSLMNPANAYLRDYFFSTNGGIRKVLEQIQSHTSNIFNSLESEFYYQGQKIKITHNLPVMEAILNSGKNITIVHGDGGCGKSGLVKDLLSDEQTFPVWLFKATDFNCPSIPEFVRKYGDCTWEDLLLAFDGAPRKLCIIDSAEKAFTMEHQDTLNQAIQTLLTHGWKVLITLRSAYIANFINLILRTSAVNEIHVPALSDQDLTDLEEMYAFSLPDDPKMRDLLRNLFYLNMYLSQDQISESQDISQFFERVWQQVICKSSVQVKLMHTRRSELICQIARFIASRGSCYYIPDATTDWDALSALCESDILRSDDTMGGYFITHDVYEELVWNHIISQEFSRKTSTALFFSSIGDALLIRKAFRVWLHNQFCIAAEDTKIFLSDVLQSNEIALIWKDEILIALMSEDHEVFTDYLDNILTLENYALLIRGIHLLNTACKVVDDELCQRILTAEELCTNKIFRFVKPSGIGWNYLISFSNSHRENIPWSPIVISLTSEVLYAWSRYNAVGTTTRESGLLALYLYRNVTGSNRKYHLEEEQIAKICDAILFSSKEIDPELTVIFEEIIAKKQTDHRDLYHKLCTHLLKDAFSTGKLCESNPDLVIRLAELFWVEDNPQTHRWDYRTNIGAHFGLREHSDHNYYPTSAFQTPILPLLNAAPDKTISFILELFEIATTSYQNSRLNSDYVECSEIEIILPNGTNIKQVASDRLWKMHRDTHVGSHLLVSILMALERWLYYAFMSVSEKAANGVCLRLLSQSHSVAITSVVTSMVLAYPQKLFHTACILIQTKEILQFDLHRLSQESFVNAFRGALPRNKIYDDERIKTNNLAFRKKRLEEIIFEYQFKPTALSEEEHAEHLTKLYASIDAAFSNEANLPQYARFALYRMDLRKMKLVREKNEDGQEQVALISNLPDNMVQTQQQVKASSEYDEKFAALCVWSMAHLEHDTQKSNKYPQYEQNPRAALSDSLNFLENPSFLQIDNQFIVYVAAALLTDFSDALDAQAFDVCCEIILTHIQNVIEDQSIRSAGDGTDAAIAALPALLGKSITQTVQENPIMLLLMLICDWGFQRDCAIKTFQEKIWQDRELAYKLISLFAQLKPDYDKEVSKYHGISPFKFFEKNLSLIDSTLEQPPQPFSDYTALSYSALITVNLLLPDVMDQEAYRVLEATGVQLWPRLFQDSRRYHQDEDWPGKYDQIHTYINWLAKILLHADTSVQHSILTKLTPHLSVSDRFNDLLSSLINTQDKYKNISSFWHIWNTLFAPVETLCSKEKESIIKKCSINFGSHYAGELDEIIETYLLAFPWWNEQALAWHTLRLEDSTFFTNAIRKIGYHPAVLYSVARVLNTVGYIYIDHGMKWLSDIIQTNPHLQNCELQLNTLYYIEEYVQRFCTSNRNKIKRNAEIKNALAVVLNYLVNRGSTCAYMLREKYC